VSHGFAKSLEVRESTQVDRKIEATLSNGARIQLHIRKQHGCQNIITVTDAGLDGDAFLKKQKLQIMKVHERIRLLPSAEPLISTRAGFLIAMKNPLLQKQILYVPFTWEPLCLVVGSLHRVLPSEGTGTCCSRFTNGFMSTALFLWRPLLCHNHSKCRQIVSGKSRGNHLQRLMRDF